MRLLISTLCVRGSTIIDATIFLYHLSISSPPPDGASSGDESESPHVSHPTPGTQIVDHATPTVPRVNATSHGFLNRSQPRSFAIIIFALYILHNTHGEGEGEGGSGHRHSRRQAIHQEHHDRRERAAGADLDMTFMSRSTEAPQFFYNEIAGFETSSRPIPPEIRCPLPPRGHCSIVHCKQENIWRAFHLIATFLMLSSHETFDEENRWFWGRGGYRRISLMLSF